MAKNVIKLNESDLQRLIRKSIANIMNEGVDELSPERYLHAAERAKEDKKNWPGRKEGSKDVAMKAKRNRQHDAFSSKAADMINQDLGDEAFHVSSDRGARTLKMDKNGRSAFLRPDSDFDTTKMYDENWVEGDEPLTLSNLEPDEYEHAKGLFNKFKGYHDRASQLEESRIRKIVSESVKKVLREWEDDPDTGVDDFWAEMDPEVARRSKHIKDNPETIKKAQEAYDKLMSECPNGYGDWEFEITEEGIDGPYTFDGYYYTDYDDENGGTWHFDVGCRGYQDANETTVEDTSYVEFTSPDGQNGIVPDR